MENNENPMRALRIEKVVVNMGVGEGGEELKKSREVIEKITDSKAVQTICRVKQPKWGIREGLPIGLKVTLRNQKAKSFLEDALKAKGNELKKKSFDHNGNFGFGIKEHIDLPKAKYDPNLGIRGFDVLVSLERKGFRVKKRKNNSARISKKHRIPQKEAAEFMRNEFGAEING